jgi:hypothetical protein
MKILGKEFTIREAHRKTASVDTLDQLFEQLEVDPKQEKIMEKLRELDLPPGNVALMQVLGSRAINLQPYSRDGALMRVRRYLPRNYQPTRLQVINLDGLCGLFFDEDQTFSVAAAKLMYEEVQKQPTYLGKAALGQYFIHELSQYREGNQCFTSVELDWMEKLKNQLKGIEKPNAVLRIMDNVKTFLRQTVGEMFHDGKPVNPDSPLWPAFKAKLDSYRETCQPKATMDYLSTFKDFRDFIDGYIILKFAGCSDSTFDLFLKRNLLKLFENDPEMKQDKERLQLLINCPPEMICDLIGGFSIRLGTSLKPVSDRNLEKVWRYIRMALAEYKMSFFSAREQGFGVLN